MEMDDDDEFGDLYTDVLHPLSSSSAPSPPPLPPYSAAPKPSPDPSLGGGRDPYGSSRPTYGAQNLSQISNFAPAADAGDDWMLGHAPGAVEQPARWDDDEDEKPAGLRVAPVSNLVPKDGPRALAVVEGEQESRVSQASDAGTHGVRAEDGDNLLGGGGEKTDMSDVDQEPVIPGLSATTYSAGAFRRVNGGDAKTSRSEDWDSDSEDDLQIVLNDSNHGPLGAERNKGLGSDEDDDEDGEEDLVIVTDEDQRHHHHPAIEEPEWVEEGMQMAVDGERKDVPEAGKGSSAVGGMAAPRIGYSSHGFHAQHHSMYKYIRPGAAPPAGVSGVASAAVPGQVRPPLGMGSSAGRGRGEWRPAIGRGVSTTQKSFHSGYGLPVWGNSPSTRAFGGGLDFTLPLHKTVFDIDIDSFEEKPWRHAGVDITDFFNFGLDEDNWKTYCKQLDQLRLESTMQSKIRVYESGRSEQDYDPDLPPELAAATGLHDTSANLRHGKTDSGQVDNSQGRASTCIRPPIPTGRAIQVEGGCGERLPSIDTRPPRIRDSDAIIEIFCQDSLDDSDAYSGALVQPGYDLHGDRQKGVCEAEVDDRPGESDRFSHTFNDKKREMVYRRRPFTPEGDGILPFPPEAPLQSHSHSKSRGFTYPGDHGGRLPQRSTRGRHSSTSADHSIDVITSQSCQANRSDSHQEEKSGDSTEGHHVSEASPAVAVETTKELSMEQGDGDHDERLALGDSIEVEGEDVVSDSRISQGTNGDDGVVHSAKGQKLSSQVEQPVSHDYCDGEDLRTTHSDSSRVKLGSARDCKQYDGGEEEVIQDGRSRRTDDLRRHHEEEERIYRRKDDYGRDGRQEMEATRPASKGGSDMYRSYPHRDLDVRGRNEVLERPKERDGSIGVWQRKEENIHSRRAKDEDMRRERMEESGLRHRNKVRVGDRKDNIEEINSRKRIDEGEWRSRDREGTSRQRERDDLLVSRREDFDGPHIRRRRDAEHTKREKNEKQDPLHGHRAREDSSRRKREREKDDASDHRRREDVIRARDRLEDYHSTRHKDDSWHHKEREGRQQLKQPHEDAQRHREREAKVAVRNGRVLEDKPLGGNGKNKDESKGLGSDKDNQHKDGRRPHEHPRRGDRISEEKISQHKGREDAHSHENKLNDEERSSRRERSGSSNDHPSNASNGQQLLRERHRENTRKSSDNEAPERNFQGLDKRKHEVHTAQHSEQLVQVSMKATTEQESNFSATLSKKVQPPILGPEVLLQVHHSSMNQVEDLASDDENEDLRRGRSKLERWTSHKERDYSTSDNKQSLSSLRAKEVEGFHADIAQTEGLPKTGGNSIGESGVMDADVGQISEIAGEDMDKHMDTVAKLKRRSERFKLPMPGEKEIVGSKKIENEVQLAQTDAPADAEVKLERPARKRRWTSG